MQHHKSAKLMKFLEMNGKILLEHFLPYTPELNPVEQQWRIMKARMAGRVHEDTEEAKAMIRKMLRTGEIRLAKMYDYLTLTTYDVASGRLLAAYRGLDPVRAAAAVFYRSIPHQ